MTTIWTYGFINLDIITQSVQQWPDYDGQIWVDNIDFKIGGVALNPAVTIAKLGSISAGLIGYIGDDPAGQIVRSELEKLGLNTSRLVTDHARPTGVCIVAVHPDAERSFIISSGANARLNSEEIAISGLTSGDFFHYGGAMILTGAQQLLKQVQAQGAMVSVDVSFDTSGPAIPGLEK
jgi:sugar/nucleoside kinase (ribokinase family)